jgi:hypothetical protein
MGVEEVGTSQKNHGGGGQVSHNKTIGCGASGAYAPGPDDEEEAEPLYLVWLNTTGRSPGITEGAVSDRLTHCHSSLRHGTHTVELGTVFQGLLLYIRCVLRKQGHLS